MITARATGSVGTRPRASSGVLQPRAGHRGQHDMAMPADKRAPLEMIEAEFVFEFFVLLLDGPPMMRQSHRAAGLQSSRSERGRENVGADATPITVSTGV